MTDIILNLEVRHFYNLIYVVMVLQPPSNKRLGENYVNQRNERSNAISVPRERYPYVHNYHQNRQSNDLMETRFEHDNSMMMPFAHKMKENSTIQNNSIHVRVSLSFCTDAQWPI